MALRPHRGAQVALWGLGVQGGVNPISNPLMGWGLIPISNPLMGWGLNPISSPIDGSPPVMLGPFWGLAGLCDPKGGSVTP